ncbi:MAG: DUF3153 domain-containing protein [Okeania sp. SIO2H7]|nr:DUF3153 domain-containing protein [Okeania sp. SIO2H7]
MKVIRILIITFLTAILLSGCVRYSMGINFDNQTHGAIVQHIKLAKKLQTFSGEIVEEWLDSVEERVRKLEGRTKRLSRWEIEAIIPVNNARDLEEKFNKFFNSTDSEVLVNSANITETSLPQLNSHLDVNQNNFLLALRNRFTLEFDLRSLSFISANNADDGGVSEPVLDLEFSLTTPWGFRMVEANGKAIAYLQDGKQLIWSLKPGDINSLEAIFWVPSPIGIGAVIIILFVSVGSFLKYQVLPLLGIGNKKTAAGSGVSSSV